MNPVRPLRQRLQAWWLARLPCTDTLTLTQRNVYILPTRGGWLFALTLLTLLITSINYQLSLGYVLTFLLAGSGVVSMHLTHATLRGLTLHLRAPQAVFAGEATLLDVVLSSAAPRTRYGVGVGVADGGPPRWAYVDLPPGGHAQAQLSFVPAARGWHSVPTIQLETRFPLGLFRVWAVWRPAARVLAYPQPESPAAPLPAARAAPGGGTSTQRSEGGDVEGVRAWRRGDAMKAVVWKQAARALATGGELVVRDTTTQARRTLWLDWQDTAGLPTEQRLSRLARWVLAADQAGLAWGLRLPGAELPPQAGEPHRQAGLERLALWA